MENFEFTSMVNTNAECAELARRLGRISRRRMDFRYVNIVDTVAGAILALTAAVSIGVLVWLS